MLMLLLLVAGVMSLLWVAVVAGFVLAEKVLPVSRITSGVVSIALVLCGLILLVTS
jgi:predicted metal-binding membrane protein